jgi:cell wall-associated NlpC family hydrolase
VARRCVLEVRRLLLPSLLILLVLTGAAVALSAPAEERRPPQRSAAYADQPRTELPPLPGKHKATVVEPVAGASGADAAPASPKQAPPTDAPKPKRAASGKIEVSRPSTAGDGIKQATALPNGIALPPLEAPEAVRQMIEAGNVIARTPYLWGGGHGKWVDKGYDCSGSVSFVLAAAGYLEAPLASGPLMSWGAPGRGKWVTIYSSQGHVFMEVAGIRFDTSGARVTGSRWQNELRSTAGFVARHPPGL